MINKILLLLVLVNFFVIGNSQTNDTVVNEENLFIQAHNLAANEYNDSLLKEYILLFPDGEFAQKANDKIDICAWQNAHYLNTKEAYSNYIKDYPKGKAVKLAKQRMLLLCDSTINSND